MLNFPLASVLVATKELRCITLTPGKGLLVASVTVPEIVNCAKEKKGNRTLQSKNRRLIFLLITKVLIETTVKTAANQAKYPAIFCMARFIN